MVGLGEGTVAGGARVMRGAGGQKEDESVDPDVTAQSKKVGAKRVGTVDWDTVILPEVMPSELNLAEGRIITASTLAGEALVAASFSHVLWVSAHVCGLGDVLGEYREVES